MRAAALVLMRRAVRARAFGGRSIPRVDRSVSSAGRSAFATCELERLRGYGHVRDRRVGAGAALGARRHHGVLVDAVRRTSATPTSADPRSERLGPEPPSVVTPPPPAPAARARRSTPACRRRVAVDARDPGRRRCRDKPRRMADPIAESLLEYRKQFPALEDCVHFISHSLGCVPAQAEDDLAEFFDLWRTKSITAWSDWLPEVDRAAARIEKIISAPQGTVIMQHERVDGHGDARVVLRVHAGAQQGRLRGAAVPDGVVRLAGRAAARRRVRARAVEGRHHDRHRRDVRRDRRAHARSCRSRTSCSRSAYIQDVKKICARAKEVGAHVILDCYQSIGTVPLDVVDLGVSFACGGSVKYVCGGPGAAWLYVRKDLIEKFAPRVTGWFGNEAPFAFTMPEQTLRRDDLALHGRHARGRRAVSGARGADDHRRDRRAQDPREEPRDDPEVHRLGRRARHEAQQPAPGGDPRRLGRVRLRRRRRCLPRAQPPQVLLRSPARPPAFASRRTSTRSPRRSICSSTS